MFGYVVTRYFVETETNVQAVFCSRCVLIHVPKDAHVQVITGATDSPWRSCDNCASDIEDSLK